MHAPRFGTQSQQLSNQPFSRGMNFFILYNQKYYYVSYLNKLNDTHDVFVCVHAARTGAAVARE